LRLFLMIGQSITYETSVLEWGLGHRLHHKYSDTDADPHNIKRGFCFSHIGWVCVKEHPLCNIKAAGLDVSDLMADSIVRFQHKYYHQCYLFCSLVMPVIMTQWIAQEGWWNAFVIVFMSRNMSNIHATFFVNSWAHMFGDRPYNDKLHSADNPFVSFIAVGEGYHNYHHSFPFDYATGELGKLLNASKLFIDSMAYLGLAYDRKQASPERIENSRLKAANKSSVNNTEY